MLRMSLVLFTSFFSSSHLGDVYKMTKQPKANMMFVSKKATKWKNQHPPKFKTQLGSAKQEALTQYCIEFLRGKRVCKFVCRLFLLLT